MSTVAIDIPDEIMQSLSDSPAELAEQVRLASAIHWYRTGKISRKAASRLAGLNPELFTQATNDSQPDIIPPEIKNEAERKATLRQAFQELADSNVVERFGDPMEWQRTVREDRPLPGRD